MHFGAFAVLGALAPRALPWRPLVVFAALVAYGAATEALQAFVPGRSPGAFDLLADAAGATVALLVRRPPSG